MKNNVRGMLINVMYDGYHADIQQIYLNNLVKISVHTQNQLVSRDSFHYAYYIWEEEGGGVVARSVARIARLVQKQIYLKYNYLDDITELAHSVYGK